MKSEFDYVIVGAGSAGCVLAARLSADSSKSVLLLEAGGWDRDPLIHIPLGWGMIFKERRHDWGYFCEPEDAVDGRAVECARGRVIGGSSSTNAMAWVHGNRADYNRWARYPGLEDWTADAIRPYMKRTETWQGGEDAWRGGSGPVGTQFCAYEDPMVEAFAEAGRDTGRGWTEDYNGENQEGFARLQMSISGGRRASAATAYLRPALKRPNLTVVTHALAERIEMTGARATGIRYRHRGAQRIARAGREVILAGGVINSPQLLMISGIGAPELLAAHGIETQVALPGVGQNLQDHPSIVLLYHRTEPGPFHRMMRYDRIVPDLVNAYTRGKGFSSDVPGGVTGFLRSSLATDVPDMQLLFTAAPLASWPWFNPLRKAFPDGFATRLVLTRPQGRGHVALKSADPAVAPAITQNWLATAQDRQVLREGIALARELGASPHMAPFVKAELSPGAAVQSAEEVEAHIRKTVITLHHPAGTCRMGAGSAGDNVVSAELKVHGVDGLRVVDASVMPDVPNGNINAAVLMIAERASEMILSESSSVRDRQGQEMSASG